MSDAPGRPAFPAAALPRVADEPFDERCAAGRALRAAVPRSIHAHWSPPPARADPVALLRAGDATRLPELVPLRYGRMLESPLAFLRGAAAIMADDLAATPTTGIPVQACGDAHLANFGAYGTPERNLVFDLNDFDETLPGPWEWDIKRLAASIVVAGRGNGFDAAQCAEAAHAAVRSYRQRLNEFARRGYLDVWYAQIDAQTVLDTLSSATRRLAGRRFEQASQRDHLRALAKWTTLVDGQVRLVEDPPLLRHVSDERIGDQLRTLVQVYAKSLRDDRQALLQRYTIVDFARKVVGVGSVGMRCYIILLRGKDLADPLFLQIKEATRSVLEPHQGKCLYPHHGQRVVRGQQLIQAASDIFLGWGQVGTTHFYIRQLYDMKGSVQIARLTPAQLSTYGEVCGWALARAHARSGDAARISGYLGAGDTFDQAVAAFATAYADQTERDHAALIAAVKAGCVSAEVIADARAASERRLESIVREERPR